MLQNIQPLFTDISTIQKKKGCDEQYICETPLYLLSILAHAYAIIIDCGVVPPRHVREIFDGLNSTENSFFQC